MVAKRLLVGWLGVCLALAGAGTAAGTAPAPAASAPPAGAPFVPAPDAPLRLVRVFLAPPTVGQRCSGEFAVRNVAADIAPDPRQDLFHVEVEIRNAAGRRALPLLPLPLRHGHRPG